MSDTTHTPGPWHVDPEYRTDRAGNMDGADQVCQPNGHTVAFLATGMDEEAHHANAHLIAAAPEMKEALKSLANEAAGFMSMADPEAHGQTNLRCLQRRIDAAHDAIAKAEGR